MPTSTSASPRPGASSSPDSAPRATTASSARPVLVTGAAGFIGMHTAIALLEAGIDVVALDRLEGPGPQSLRRARLQHLRDTADGQCRESEREATTRDPDRRPARLHYEDIDISDEADLRRLDSHDFDRIVHLAAQAGVRHSIENPAAYTRSNLVGTANVLEVARRRGSTHLVYASSSSVYGGRTEVPFRESDRIDRPVSYYAATKAANEVMAASYGHLYALPTTGLRFFTVYGPWGRPDMAPWLFTSAILEGRPLRIFAEGRLQRDFTYVDDIVRGVVGILGHPPDPVEGYGPVAIYNIGNNRPHTVNQFVATLESILGRTALREEAPMQAGDVPVTCADISRLNAALGFAPSTSLRHGLQAFADWYRRHHDV